MTEWTSQAVASRFAEAARTARRLPPVRVQGHFNVWPPFVRTEAEVLCAEDPPPRRFPPSPAEIERMLVTMRWRFCTGLSIRRVKPEVRYEPSLRIGQAGGSGAGHRR